MPIVAGGSALYMRAILDEFEFPGTDPAVRERLEAELAEIGAAALHARLAAIADWIAKRHNTIPTADSVQAVLGAGEA